MTKRLVGLAFAARLDGFDEDELLITRITPHGVVYKSDDWLFGLDCAAVEAAYRTASGFLIQTSTYDPHLGLAFAGIYGPAERTTVDGRPAFLVRPRSALGLPSLALTWATSSGHIVLIIGQMTEDELRAFATELRRVDRPTWEAELSPLDGDPED